MRSPRSTMRSSSRRTWAHGAPPGFDETSGRRRGLQEKEEVLERRKPRGEGGGPERRGNEERKRASRRKRPRGEVYEAPANRAKRAAGRPGPNARTRTPSGVSWRLTSPATSCSSARLAPLA